MTGQQIKDLVQEYSRTLLRPAGDPEQYPLNKRVSISEIVMDGEAQREVDKHILWMCRNMPKDDEAKINRWLGFIQGAIWSFGARSINELRKENIG